MSAHKQCSVCEGEEHHWLPWSEGDWAGFVCKHCPARAEEAEDLDCETDEDGRELPPIELYPGASFDGGWQCVDEATEAAETREVLKSAVEMHRSNLNYLAEVFRIVEGATRGDSRKVQNYGRLLADKLEEAGEENSARWLRRILDGNAGAQIFPAQSKNDHIDLRCPHCHQVYTAKIGNNPLVRDGLTLTPLPLPVEVEVEGEQ